LALVARIFVVLFAFLLACVVAAAAVTFALVLPATHSIDQYPDQQSFELAFRMAAIFISLYTILLYATLPAMLVIALAEGFHLRSVLFYALAGAVLALGSAYGWDLSFLRSPDDDFSTHGAEIVAAIGIAAGFVYWALAGRTAGAWREPSPDVSVARSVRAPE
jgi:hypothetical protein